MDFANSLPLPSGSQAPPLLFAVLRPHRSLSRRGFAVVMGLLAAMSLGVGTTFFLLGAWPVPGFLGLDVVAVYGAIRLYDRRARAAEEIRVTLDRLTVRKLSPAGKAEVTEMNPLWARLEIDRHAEFGITRMALASHGRSLLIGAFLGSAEREELASALSAALAKARGA